MKYFYAGVVKPGQRKTINSLLDTRDLRSYKLVIPSLGVRESKSHLLHFFILIVLRLCYLISHKYQE